MERTVSVKKYLTAFILTIVIFLGGVFIGVFLENVRLKDSQQITLNEKVNLLSLQLQQRYIETGLANCNALNQILETNIAELTKKLATIVDYEKNAVLNEKEFRLQLRDYFLTEIQFFLTAQEIDKKCRKENVKVIYFYDENEQDTQGKILDYLKERFEDKLLVFSFDSRFADEPMIKILLTSYNIKKFPAVVVGNAIFEEHVPLEKLLQVVCSEFKNIKGVLPESCLEQS